MRGPRPTERRELKEQRKETEIEQTVVYKYTKKDIARQVVAVLWRYAERKMQTKPRAMETQKNNCQV